MVCDASDSQVLRNNTEAERVMKLHTIGFDAKRAAQNRTGLGNYSRFVINGLSRYAPDLHQVLYVPNPKRVEALKDVDDIENLTLRYPNGMWKAARSAWRTWGITHQLEVDGIQLYHGLSGELPLNINKARDVRSIVTIHDLIFLRYPELYKPIDRKIYEYKFRRACQQADRIIAVSKQTCSDVIDFFGIDASKISVVYQGCNESFRKPVSEEMYQEVRQHYNLPERYILYVGSIEERKNLGLLADALAQIGDKEVHVVAVGRRTPYADQVQQRVNSLGLAACFRMISGVPFAHLPALYQQASLFVYPSRFEGFGIPLLEALCSGTPVIGCTGSCLEEAGGPSSIYVDPDDATALAQAINDVLSDDELSSHMSSEGLKYAQQFEAEALTMNLLKEYSTLC